MSLKASTWREEGEGWEQPGDSGLSREKLPERPKYWFNLEQGGKFYSMVVCLLCSSYAGK